MSTDPAALMRAYIVLSLLAGIRTESAGVELTGTRWAWECRN